MILATHVLNCIEQIAKGRERKLDGRAQKVGRRRVHAHFIRPPPFPLADFKEQAGRTQGRHKHVRAPSVLKVNRGR
jgi:hypothetical protein